MRPSKLWKHDVGKGGGSVHLLRAKLEAHVIGSSLRGSGGDVMMKPCQNLDVQVLKLEGQVVPKVAVLALTSFQAHLPSSLAPATPHQNHVSCLTM